MLRHLRLVVVEREHLIAAPPHLIERHVARSPRWTQLRPEHPHQCVDQHLVRAVVEVVKMVEVEKQDFVCVQLQKRDHVGEKRSYFRAVQPVHNLHRILIWWARQAEVEIADAVLQLLFHIVVLRDRPAVDDALEAGQPADVLHPARLIIRYRSILVQRIRERVVRTCRLHKSISNRTNTVEGSFLPGVITLSNGFTVISCGRSVIHRAMSRVAIFLGEVAMEESTAFSTNYASWRRTNHKY